MTDFDSIPWNSILDRCQTCYALSSVRFVAKVGTVTLTVSTLHNACPCGGRNMDFTSKYMVWIKDSACRCRGDCTCRAGRTEPPMGRFEVQHGSHAALWDHVIRDGRINDTTEEVKRAKRMAYDMLLTYTGPEQSGPTDTTET